MKCLFSRQARGSLCRRAGLAAVGALMLAVVATVPQADAVTIYACQKKGGTIRIVTRKGTKAQNIGLEKQARPLVRPPINRA